MNLDKELGSTLEHINKVQTPKPQALIPLIDLTLLDSDASPTQISALALKAQKHHVAAICIFPEHLKYIPSNIKINKATVINFPSGLDDQNQILKSIEQLMLHNPVDEIDYVFPYQAYLAKQEKKALRNYEEVYTLCKQYQLSFKAILETGALPCMDVIYQLSMDILNIGCDFLKTSTGKIPQGASLPAAFSMLQAIKDTHSNCGIKVSGGVKTAEQAISYFKLAQLTLNREVDPSCFRIGASSLLDALIN